MAHFKDHFKPDDLIYGMGQAIHLYIYNYYYRWRINKPSFDKLTSKQSGQAHDNYGKNVINKYNENMSPKMFSLDSASKGAKVSVDLSQTDETADPSDIFQDYFSA